ncbi:hypothetical protein [Sphingomonas oryzagri]|uniref:Uncharacterized protein n=1 Tax=Sphingomonas oryzagri TaxID=3042314 RepID=A0ABT6N392_9SPHN|nr:hypothetical protein [Sphingomonas oryzagri]MDH7639228.1 hypothetical protein [Sphingomonas oryzagri]
MPHELHTQLFLVTMLFGWGLALTIGKAAERTVTGILIVGASLSILALPVSMAARFQHLEWSAAAVDGLLLAALLGAAHHFKAGWILWMTAFQFMIILSHLPILFRPLISSESYVASTALWSWLMMLTLIQATGRNWLSRRQTGISRS